MKYPSKIKGFVIAILVIVIIIFVIVEIHYKSIVVFHYKGNKIELLIDRYRSSCLRCVNHYNLEGKEYVLHHKVMLNNKCILRFKLQPLGGEVVHGNISENHSFMYNDTLQLFVEDINYFVVHIPLDGKRRKVKDLRVTGFKTKGNKKFDYTVISTSTPITISGFYNEKEAKELFLECTNDY